MKHEYDEDEKDTKKSAKSLNDTEIVGRLSTYISEAMNRDDGDISSDRQENYDYYVGKPYGNERRGYSKVVTREVFETVEWAMPSVIRVFASGDRVVSFEATGPDDEPEADQETDLSNYMLMQRADGFVAIHDWVKGAMLDPNAYLKVWMDECTKTVVREFHNLSAHGLQKVLQRYTPENGYDEVEILEQEIKQVKDLDPKSDAPQPDQQSQPGVPTQAGQPGVPPMAGPQQPPAPGGVPGPIPPVAPANPLNISAYLKIRAQRTERKLQVKTLPGSEVLVKKGFTGHNLDECDFVCHRSRQTFSDLVSYGYDPEELRAVKGPAEATTDTEKSNKLFYDEENDEDAGTDPDEALTEYWVHECFVDLDADQDGVAERRRVVLIGDHVFANEEDDYTSIVGISSILIPNRHVGMSIADTVKDLQLLSSTLRRQLLDNIYRLNIRKKYVGERFLLEGGLTIDALMDPTTEIVPSRDPTALVPEQVQPIIGDLLPVIQDLDNTKQVRTGIAPNLSLDPEVLQQATMGAFANALNEASQRIEMLVRILAETGFKHLMLKVHRLLRENIDRRMTVKLRGEWIEVDPSSWDERPNVRVNVGLGFHNKEQRVQLLMALLQQQKEALPLGMANEEKLYNTLTKLVEDSGLGNVQEFFTKPGNADYVKPQTPQDPMAQAAQAQMQVEQGKLQQSQMKLQQDTQEAMGRLQIEMKKLQGYLGEITARIGNIEADTKLKEAQTAKIISEIGRGSLDDTLKVDSHLRDGELSQKREERDDVRTGFDIARAKHDLEASREDRDFNRYTSERDFQMNQPEEGEE